MKFACRHMVLFTPRGCGWHNGISLIASDLKLMSHRAGLLLCSSLHADLINPILIENNKRDEPNCGYENGPKKYHHYEDIHSINEAYSQRSMCHLLHVVGAILRVLDLLPAVRQLCRGTEKKKHEPQLNQSQSTDNCCSEQVNNPSSCVYEQKDDLQ